MVKGDPMKTTHKLRLNITNLACGGGGALTLERALQTLSGVNSVYINPLTEQAYITYDTGKLDASRLMEVVKHAGYSAKQIQP